MTKEYGPSSHTPIEIGGKYTLLIEGKATPDSGGDNVFRSQSGTHHRILSLIKDGTATELRDKRFRRIEAFALKEPSDRIPSRTARIIFMEKQP